MNLWRKFEEIVKPWMMVVLFIVLLVFGFYHEAKAEVQVEGGAGLLSGELSHGSALILSERWSDGKYALGMGYISEQDVVDRSGDLYHVDENLFVFAQRRVHVYREIHLGIGVAHFNATNRALGSKFTAALSVEWVWDGPNSAPVSINLRHFSNAGSAKPNMGQDILTIGWRFL